MYIILDLTLSPYSGFVFDTKMFSHCLTGVSQNISIYLTVWLLMGQPQSVTSFIKV